MPAPTSAQGRAFPQGTSGPFSVQTPASARTHPVCGGLAPRCWAPHRCGLQAHSCHGLTHTQTHTYTLMNTCTHSVVHTLTALTHAQPTTHMHTCTHIQTHSICAGTYTHEDKQKHILVHIHTYSMHTHTHTHTHSKHMLPHMQPSMESLLVQVWPGEAGRRPGALTTVLPQAHCIKMVS